MAKRTRYNPESSKWFGVSYKQGKRITELRDNELDANDFGMNELRDKYPGAYNALPEAYQNDNCLTFFLDINNNLCAEYNMGGEWIWNGKIWLQGK
jgi:hypothetical protein